MGIGMSQAFARKINSRHLTGKIAVERIERLEQQRFNHVGQQVLQHCSHFVYGIGARPQELRHVFSILLLDEFHELLLLLDFAASSENTLLGQIGLVSTGGQLVAGSEERISLLLPAIVWRFYFSWPSTGRNACRFGISLVASNSQLWTGSRRLEKLKQQSKDNEYSCIYSLVSTLVETKGQVHLNQRSRSLHLF
jgi:hypothetical protein